MSRISPTRRPRPLHRARPLAAAALALAAVLGLSACNGEDIASLPEAQGRCGGKAGTLVTLDYASRSWWDETGFHQVGSSGYLLAGWLIASGYPTVRGFAEFDLSGVSGCIRAGAFLLQPDQNFGGDPIESYSLWQVTTDAATLNGDWTTTLNPPVYADLGDGVNYGAFSVDTSAIGVPVTVPLTVGALDDISAKLGGSFVLGLRPDSLTKPPTADEWVRFGFGGDPTPTQLLLYVVN